MRISLVFLFCFFVLVVHANNEIAEARFASANGGSGITKTSTKKSPYDYLRSVRGKASCATGTCPFWERHGRSFAALRCYAQEYRECACLHRMCFGSCMFNRTICNQEMVSCLQQICRRCMSVSEQAVCKVYDSMAERVAESLSTFSCYACCPSNQNANANANKRPTNNGMTPTQVNGAQPGAAPAPVQSGSSNSPKPVNNVNGQKPVNGGNGPKPTNGANVPRPVNNVNAPRPVNGANGPKPVNGANAPKPVNGVNAPRPVNGVNAPRPVNGVNFPNPANGANAPRPVNGVNAPQPVNGVNAPRPVNGVNAARPVNGVNAPRPANGVNAPRPVNGANAPRPANGVNAPRPVNGGNIVNGGLPVGNNQQSISIQVSNNVNAARPPNGLPPNALPNASSNGANRGNQPAKIASMPRQSVRPGSTTRRITTVGNSNMKNKLRTSTARVQNKPKA